MKTQELQQENKKLRDALKLAFEAMVKQYDGEENLNFIDIRNVEKALKYNNQDKQNNGH